MSKEDDLMAYLYENVFDPILDSQNASKELKAGVRLTIVRMRERDAAGMLSYYWSAIKGTDRSVRFAELMRQEGFNRFEEILEDFRVRFDDRWLHAPEPLG